MLYDEHLLEDVANLKSFCLQKTQRGILETWRSASRCTETNAKYGN